MPITPVTITAAGHASPVVYGATNVPPGLTFTDNGNDTATISGTIADGSAAGSPYVTTVNATDNNGVTDTVPVTFDVSPALRYPNSAGVANPAAPAEVLSSYVPPSLPDANGHTILAGKDLLLVSARESGAASSVFVDISNPANPVEVGAPWNLSLVVNTGGTTGANTRGVVDFTSRRLFLSGNAKAAVYDISDPTTPVLVKSTAAANAGDVGFNGTYFLAQTAIHSSTFTLFDTDGNVVRSFSGATDFQSAQKAFSFADEVWFGVESGASAQLQQYRFNGSTPSHWASYPNTDTLTNSSQWSVRRLDANHVVFFNTSNTNATRSVKVFALNVAQGSTGNAPVGSTAPITMSSASYSTTSQASPSQLMATDTNGTVYVAANEDAVAIVDCSTPTAPVLASTIDYGTGAGNGIPMDVNVTNGKLVVTRFAVGIHIYT